MLLARPAARSSSASTPPAAPRSAAWPAGARPRRPAAGARLRPPALPLVFLLDGALRAPPDVERLRLVGLDAQRRVAADDGRAELAGVELGDALADQRRRLRAAPRRRFGLLPRQLDLGAQVLEDPGVGAVAGRLLGVGTRLLERAVDDGAARLLDRVADPLLAGPLARRLLVDRRLGALADLRAPRRGPAGRARLRWWRGWRRSSRWRSRAVRARCITAASATWLRARATASRMMPMPVWPGRTSIALADQRVCGLDVAAAERRLGLGEVLVGVLLVERGLGPGPQLVRASGRPRRRRWRGRCSSIASSKRPAVERLAPPPRRAAPAARRACGRGDPRPGPSGRRGFGVPAPACAGHVRSRIVLACARPTRPRSRRRRTRVRSRCIAGRSG